MSLRDDIIDNLQTALEGIISISDPLAAAGNTGLPVGLIVQSGGTYTHTAQTQYKVAIEVGGVSGTAECSITDITDGTDSVVGNVVVTTANAMDLGTRGGTLTITLPSGESLTVGDYWTVTCDTYNTTVKQVLRAKAVGVNISMYPTIVIARAPQEYEQVDGPRYRNRMRVYAEAWIEERENIDDELALILEDMENAVQIDASRNGNALDTILIRNEPGIPEAGRPYGSILLEMEIAYLQVINP